MRWRDVIDYEQQYEVNEIGEVRRKDCLVPHSKTGTLYVKKGGSRKILTLPSGYQNLRLCKNGKCVNISLHRIVAKAFIPNPHNLRDVNHIDKDRSNNKADNLEWLSHKDNCKFSSENYAKKGVKNPRAKLTEDQVREIRSLRGVLTWKQLSEKYKVNTCSIGKVLRGVSYNEVR